MIEEINEGDTKININENESCSKSDYESLNNDEDEMREDQIKEKNKNKTMRGNKKLNKYPNLGIREENSKASPEILDSKILGGGSYQSSPEILNDSKIRGGRSYQTSSKFLNNPRITDESSQTFLVYSTPVDCEEGSNQTSLGDTIKSYLREPEKKSSLNLEKIRFPWVGIHAENNQNNTSHITKDQRINSKNAII